VHRAGSGGQGRLSADGRKRRRGRRTLRPAGRLATGDRARHRPARPPLTAGPGRTPRGPVEAAAERGPRRAGAAEDAAGHDRLEDEPGLLVSMRRAHAMYFADWTRAQWEHLTGDGRDAASERMAADIENIRSAWRYWVAESDFEQLGKFTDSLWLFYDARGWY